MTAFGRHLMKLFAKILTEREQRQNERSSCIDGVRTAIGKAGKGSYFANVRADELGAVCLKELVKRTGVNPEMIEDSYWGISTAHGENGYDIARVINMLSGLPLSMPGVQLNRFCASGLVAVQMAASTIMSGWGDCFVAGGVEHMTRTPVNLVKFFHPQAWRPY